jgi:hypothetical protein
VSFVAPGVSFVLTRLSVMSGSAVKVEQIYGILRDTASREPKEQGERVRRDVLICGY